MTTTIRITTVAVLADDKMAREWVQHVRDFDTAHMECHVQMLADAPGHTVEEMRALVDSIEPKLPFTTTMTTRR